MGPDCRVDGYDARDAGRSSPADGSTATALDAATLDAATGYPLDGNNDPRAPGQVGNDAGSGTETAPAIAGLDARDSLSVPDAISPGPDALIPPDANSALVPDAAPEPEFRIVGHSPAPDATAVEPNTEITITFSDAIDPVRLSSTSVVLRDVDLGQQVAGKLRASGGTLTFAPAGRLGLLGHYEVAVDAAIRGAGARPLAGPALTFRFSVRDGKWQEPAILTENPSYNSVNLASSETGAVVAIWALGDGTKRHLFSSILPAAEGRTWSDAVNLSENVPGAFDFVESIVVAGESAIVLAKRMDIGGSVRQLWSRRFDTQWRASAPIQLPANIRVTSARICSGGSNLAGLVACWLSAGSMSSPATYDLVKSENTNGIWGGVMSFWQSPAISATPLFSLDRLGVGFVHWIATNAQGETELWAHRLVNQAFLGSAERLLGVPMNMGVLQTTVGSHEGTSVAVTYDSGSPVASRLSLSRFDGVSWTKAKVLRTADAIHSVEMAVRKDHVLIATSESNGGIRRLWAGDVRGSTLGREQAVDTDAAPLVVSDPRGNGLVFFKRTSDPHISTIRLSGASWVRSDLTLPGRRFETMFAVCDEAGAVTLLSYDASQLSSGGPFTLRARRYE